MEQWLFAFLPCPASQTELKIHRDHAIEEIELMHKAIDLGDYIPSPCPKYGAYDVGATAVFVMVFWPSFKNS
jgi:hypothetical protein